MRHDPGRLRSYGVSLAEGIAAILLMLAVAAVLAVGHQAANAGPPAEEAAYPPFNLDYFTNDAQLVIALRPAALARLKSLESFKPVLKELGITEPLGLPIEEIEEFRVVLSIPTPELPPGPDNMPWPILMVRASRPFGWKKLAAATISGEVEEHESNGQVYYTREAAARPLRFGLLASRQPHDRFDDGESDRTHVHAARAG